MDSFLPCLFILARLNVLPLNLYFKPILKIQTVSSFRIMWFCVNSFGFQRNVQVLIYNFCNFLIIQTVSNFQFTTMLYLGQYFRFSALHWLHILLSLVSRFGIAVLFGVLYVYTGELFPTVIRSIVMGTVSIGARIGSIISPYLYDVVSNNLYLQLSYIKSLFMYQGCITTFPRSHSHCSNSMTVTL